MSQVNENNISLEVRLLFIVRCLTDVLAVAVLVGWPFHVGLRCGWNWSVSWIAIALFIPCLCSIYLMRRPQMRMLAAHFITRITRGSKGNPSGDDTAGENGGKTSPMGKKAENH